MTMTMMMMMMMILNGELSRLVKKPHIGAFQVPTAIRVCFFSLFWAPYFVLYFPPQDMKFNDRYDSYKPTYKPT